jgi:hypothetical protein
LAALDLESHPTPFHLITGSSLKKNKERGILPGLPSFCKEKVIFFCDMCLLRPQQGDPDPSAHLKYKESETDEKGLFTEYCH